MSRVLGVTLNSKLMFETHLREVVSKATGNRGVVPRAPKLFDCPRVIKNCFNAYVFPAWCINPLHRYRQRSLIWVCWIVLFAVQKVVQG